jgi:hypothetical protein
MLGWEAAGEFLVGVNSDSSQQRLHVGARDAIGLELRRQRLAVEQCDGEQVGQRVVGLLLGRDGGLLALLAAAADDRGGDVEDVELEQSLERGLSVDLGVVALDEGRPGTVELLVLPVDLERPGDCVAETFGRFEDLCRARDAAGGEELMWVAANAVCG